MTETHLSRSDGVVVSHPSVTLSGQKLTPRHDAILAYLREKPGATVREVGDAVGLSSPASVHFALGRLEKMQLLKRVPCPKCSGDMWLVRTGS